MIVKMRTVIAEMMMVREVKMKTMMIMITGIKTVKMN